MKHLLGLTVSEITSKTISSCLFYSATMCNLYYICQALGALGLHDGWNLCPDSESSLSKWRDECSYAVSSVMEKIQDTVRIRLHLISDKMLNGWALVIQSMHII